MKDDPLNRLKVKRGSQLPQAKLTESDVEDIRDAPVSRLMFLSRAAGLADARIAKRLGLPVRVVRAVAELPEKVLQEIRCDVQRRELYRRMARERTAKGLAKRYGVHERTIERIIQGLGWLHVDDKGGE